MGAHEPRMKQPQHLPQNSRLQQFSVLWKPCVPVCYCSICPSSPHVFSSRSSRACGLRIKKGTSPWVRNPELSQQWGIGPVGFPQATQLYCHGGPHQLTSSIYGCQRRNRDKYVGREADQVSGLAENTSAFPLPGSGFTGQCWDTSAGFWRAPHRSAKEGGTGPSCVLPPLRVGRSCEHVLSNPLHRDRS